MLSLEQRGQQAQRLKFIAAVRTVGDARQQTVTAELPATENPQGRKMHDRTRRLAIDIEKMVANAQMGEAIWPTV